MLKTCDFTIEHQYKNAGSVELLINCEWEPSSNNSDVGISDNTVEDVDYTVYYSDKFLRCGAIIQDFISQQYHGYIMDRVRDYE